MAYSLHDGKRPFVALNGPLTPGERRFERMKGTGRRHDAGGRKDSTGARRPVRADKTG